MAVQEQERIHTDGDRETPRSDLGGQDSPPVPEGQDASSATGRQDSPPIPGRLAPPPVIGRQDSPVADSLQGASYITENAIFAFLNRKVIDSVFTDLFRIPRYQVAFYHALHPDRPEITENDISNVTLRNIFFIQIYNDLGMLVHDRYLILAEEQTVWSTNILLRGLFYLSHTLEQLTKSLELNLYSSKAVTIPEIELIVICPRETAKPDTITLSAEYYDGAMQSVEVRTKVITYSGGDDIINQYIQFVRIYDEQRKGRTTRDDITKAVDRTIRICIENDVLKDYLTERGKEVHGIMMRMYDDESIIRGFLAEHRKEVQQEEQKIKEEEIAKIIQEKNDEMAKLAKENAARTVRQILNLRDYSKVSVTTAMDMLGIPGSERPELLAMM